MLQYDFMKYKELFAYCLNELNRNGIGEADSDSRLLFEYLINADRSFMFLHGEDEVSDTEKEKIIEAVNRRIEHIPLQHITGKQNFMGLEFNVSEDVLIPRFDTECLVEEAMLVTNDGDKVLDVCTGSGCILISLMNYKNDIKGYGCDISEAALKVARKNSDELCKPKLSSSPLFINSDLFDSITERDFDIIVSNPPYIRSDVIPTLMTEVREHDPMIALDGGEDGLVFYRRIISQAVCFLKKGGHLLVEIGFDQGNDVRKLFLENGYSDVKIIKDLAGNDRVVRGCYIKEIIR